MKLTIQKAYELAVKKWEYIVENNGSISGLYKKYPVLHKMFSGCSYCELFNDDVTGCKGCPIRKKRRINPGDVGCEQPNHPYNRWVYNNTTANAQAILDLIIKTKPEGVTE